MPLLALMERNIYPYWLSPANGGPGSNQILISTVVQVYTRYPAHERGNHTNEASAWSVHPLWVIEKHEDGVYAHTAYLLTSRTDPEAHTSHQR
jgi:hypothetical protein